MREETKKDIELMNQPLKAEIVLLTEKIKKLQAELAELKEIQQTDYNHAVANCNLAVNLQSELEKLKKFVDEWDGHEVDCEYYDEGSPRTDYCTCGYVKAKQALKGDE